MKEKIAGVCKRLVQYGGRAFSYLRKAAVTVARVTRPLWQRIGHGVAVAAVALWHLLLWLWDACYGYHYSLGVFVLRKARRVARFAARITRKPRHFMRYLWIVGVTRPIRRFFRRIWRLISGLPLSLIHVWKTKKLTVGNLLMWLPRSILRWLRDYAEEWYSLGRFLGPVAGGVVLLMTMT